jgi:hypothetical protein
LQFYNLARLCAILAGKQRYLMLEEDAATMFLTDLLVDSNMSLEVVMMPLVAPRTPFVAPRTPLTRPLRILPVVTNTSLCAQSFPALRLEVLQSALLDIISSHGRCDSFFQWIPSSQQDSEGVAPAPSKSGMRPSWCLEIQRYNRIQNGTLTSEMNARVVKNQHKHYFVIDIESLRRKLPLKYQLNSRNQCFNIFNISSFLETMVLKRRFQRIHEMLLGFQGSRWTKGGLSKMVVTGLVERLC